MPHKRHGRLHQCASAAFLIVAALTSSGQTQQPTAGSSISWGPGQGQDPARFGYHSSRWRSIGGDSVPSLPSTPLSTAPSMTTRSATAAPSDLGPARPTPVSFPLSPTAPAASPSANATAVKPGTPTSPPALTQIPNPSPPSLTPIPEAESDEKTVPAREASRPAETQKQQVPTKTAVPAVVAPPATPAPTPIASRPEPPTPDRVPDARRSALANPADSAKPALVEPPPLPSVQATKLPVVITEPMPKPPEIVRVAAPPLERFPAEAIRTVPHTEPAPPRPVVIKQAAPPVEEPIRPPTRVVLIRPNAEEPAPRSGTVTYRIGAGAEATKPVEAVDPFRPSPATTDTAGRVDPFQPQVTPRPSSEYRKELQPFGVPGGPR
jgi:hypothetical protein